MCFALENRRIFTPQGTLTISEAKDKVLIHSTGYHLPEPTFFSLLIKWK